MEYSSWIIYLILSLHNYVSKEDLSCVSKVLVGVVTKFKPYLLVTNAKEGSSTNDVP